MVRGGVGLGLLVDVFFQKDAAPLGPCEQVSAGELGLGFVDVFLLERCFSGWRPCCDRTVRMRTGVCGGIGLGLS